MKEGAHEGAPGSASDNPTIKEPHSTSSTVPQINSKLLEDYWRCRKEGKFARATFYDKLRNGTGPKHMRIGRLIRIRRPDWEAWLQSCEVDPGKRAA